MLRDMPRPPKHPLWPDEASEKPEAPSDTNDRPRAPRRPKQRSDARGGGSRQDSPGARLDITGSRQGDPGARQENPDVAAVKRLVEELRMSSGALVRIIYEATGEAELSRLDARGVKKVLRRLRTEAGSRGGQASRPSRTRSEATPHKKRLKKPRKG